MKLAEIICTIASLGLITFAPDSFGLVLGVLFLSVVGILELIDRANMKAAVEQAVEQALRDQKTKQPEKWS